MVPRGRGVTLAATVANVTLAMPEVDVRGRRQSSTSVALQKASTYSWALIRLMVERRNARSSREIMKSTGATSALARMRPSSKSGSSDAIAIRQIDSSMGRISKASHAAATNSRADGPSKYFVKMQ